MPVSADQFLERLTACGLVPPEELSAFCNQLTPQQREDPQRLAKALVRQGKLSAYQAQLIYQDKTSSLVFGEYTVLDKLGAGGMGVVLRARHRRMDREVAIKVLPRQALRDEAFVHRFYKEVRAAAKLMHPNIVTAFDAGEHEGMHYLVMEYVEGKDLAAILSQSGPLPIQQAVQSILQAARGLEYAHEHGIVHRDIKPANLLLGKDGTIKLLDLGLARLTGELGQRDEPAIRQLTQTGQIMGTVDYMAPEQAMDTRTADHRADIYALGCTLFRLLTGRNVYEADTVMKRLMAHQHAPIPSLRDIRPDVPAALERTFQRMIAKNPAARQQSMRELIKELQDAAPSTRPSDLRTGREPSADAALSEFFAKLEQEQRATTTKEAQTPSATDRDTVVYRPGIEDTGDQLPNVANRVTVASSDAAAIERQTRLLSRKEFSLRNKRKTIAWFAAIGGTLCVATLLGLAVFLATGDGQLQRPETAASGTSVTGVQADSFTFHDRRGTSGYALAFNGSTSHVELVALRLDGTRPFTLEAWTTPDSARPGAIFSQSNSSGGVVLRKDYASHWGLLFRDREDWKQTLEEVGTTAGDLSQDAGRVIPGQRQHVAFVFDGTMVRLFVDGNQTASIGILGDRIPIPSGTTFRVGAAIQSDKLGLFYDGTIEEIRISRVARYRDNFRPPANYVFESDTDTLALYHCDEGQGTALVDSSGNDCHGKIVDATWKIADRPPTEAWTHLFNGRDLTGWLPQGYDGWRVENCVLVGETQDQAVGWLMSELEYEDYELELEYKLAAGGNSGLFPRAWPGGPPNGSAFTEIQLLDDQASQFDRVGPDRKTGAIFGKLAPAPRPVAPPDTWNRLRIWLQGQSITVAINDVEVISSVVSELPPKGHIGLQLYPPEIQFRDIRLRATPDRTPKKSE